MRENRPELKLDRIIDENVLQILVLLYLFLKSVRQHRIESIHQSTIIRTGSAHNMEHNITEINMNIHRPLVFTSAFVPKYVAIKMNLLLYRKLDEHIGM